jgi:hypothetical protein
MFQGGKKEMLFVLYYHRAALFSSERNGLDAHTCPCSFCVCGNLRVRHACVFKIRILRELRWVSVSGHATHELDEGKDVQTRRGRPGLEWMSARH